MLVRENMTFRDNTLNLGNFWCAFWTFLTYEQRINYLILKIRLENVNVNNNYLHSRRWRSLALTAGDVHRLMTRTWHFNSCLKIFPHVRDTAGLKLGNLKNRMKKLIHHLDLYFTDIHSQGDREIQPQVHIGYICDMIQTARCFLCLEPQQEMKPLLSVLLRGSWDLWSAELFPCTVPLISGESKVTKPQATSVCWLLCCNTAV